MKSKSKPQKSIPSTISEAEKEKQKIFKLQFGSEFDDTFIVKQASPSPFSSDSGASSSVIDSTKSSSSKKCGSRSSMVVTWKANPITINPNEAFFSSLSANEIKTCQTLRLLPWQYLEVKEKLIYHWQKDKQFKKRDAQKLCHIDVNKVSKIYDWFWAIGIFEG